MTSASIVGLPLESRISLAIICLIFTYFPVYSKNDFILPKNEIDSGFGLVNLVHRLMKLSISC